MDLSTVDNRGMTGSQLRAVRRALGLTQAALAGRLAVSSNTVARWERDEVRITPPMVRLIHLVADRGGSQSRKAPR
jgi:DNA-binding transcriptional regulator YiaG